MSGGFKNLFIDDCLPNIWSVGTDGILDTNCGFRTAGHEAVSRRYQAFKATQPNGDTSLAELVRNSDQVEKDSAKVAGFTWMGIPPDLVSADEYCAEPAGSGGLQVKGGMGRIVHALGTILERKGVKILTNHQITSVKHDENGVTFRYSINNKVGQVSAKFGVMTPSVAVLQSGSIQFVPDLPTETTQVINRFRMSQLNKVIVPLKDGFFTRQKNPVGPDTRIYFMREDRAFFAHCRSGGTDSLQLLGANVTVNDLALVQQSGILGNLDGGLITNAPPLLLDSTKNPYILGSYSLCDIGQQRSPANLLVGRRLIIAGEAHVSNEDGASTMDGALLSGQRAAEHIKAQSKFENAFSIMIPVRGFRPSVSPPVIFSQARRAVARP